MSTGHKRKKKRKKKRKEKDNVFEGSLFVLYVLIFTLDWLNIHLTQKTRQSLYRCKYSLFNSQNAKCLVIEVVSILQFISLTHYLHEMIQWAIYSLIVKQVFPFQFWHALLVLCTPLSSAQWSYAEIRQKKQW